MSHPIPIVAPAVGGLPEVVKHGKTGWLVKNRGASEYAGIIKNLISDNRTLSAAGENGHKRAQKYFSIDCMTKSYIENYLCVKV